jgi:hypothetical protein
MHGLFPSRLTSTLNHDFNQLNAHTNHAAGMLALEIKHRNLPR